MCEFFVTADPILYESRTRSVRIHGVHTSIRLENFVWDTLAILAADENMTTNALIVQFHDEILHHPLSLPCSFELVAFATKVAQKRTLQTTH